MRDCVVVEGPDAASYLQGQLSQDVAAIEIDGGDTWTFVLQPQGKVDVLARIRRVGENQYELDVDAGWGSVLEARLSRFLMRTKATVTLAEGKASDAFPSEERRIELGWPAMGSEIDEKTVPAELGRGVVSAAVSFTKGCYTGQELVARMDSRSAAPPRLLKQVVAASALDPRATIVADGKDLGPLTSAAGTHGLVFVPRSAGDPTVGEAVWEGGAVAVELRTLPPDHDA